MMGAQMSNAAVSFAGMAQGAEQTRPGLSSALLAIAPGPTKVLSSSLSTSWQGILLERHLCSPGVRACASIDRLHAPSEFIHRALEESFTRDVVEDLGRAIPRPVFRSGIQENSIQRILGLLIEELEASRPLGRLYVDSLAHALITRYVSFEHVHGARKEPRVQG